MRPVFAFNPILCVFLIVVTALTACRERPEVTGTDLGAGTNTEDSNRPLVILTWDEYFSDEVIAEFEAEVGIAVEFVNFTNLHTTRQNPAS